MRCVSLGLFHVKPLQHNILRPKNDRTQFDVVRRPSAAIPRDCAGIADAALPRLRPTAARAAAAPRQTRRAAAVSAPRELRFARRRTAAESSFAARAFRAGGRVLSSIYNNEENRAKTG